MTAAEAGDLGCSHLSPFLPGPPPCPTLCPPSAPQPLGRWTVRSWAPSLGERKNRAKGRGLGSDHAQQVTAKGPPLSPKGGGLREGWTPEVGVGSFFSIRQETELGEQEQVGVRTTASPAHNHSHISPARSYCSQVSQLSHPSSHWVSQFSKPYHSGPPGQST